MPARARLRVGPRPSRCIRVARPFEGSGPNGRSWAVRRWYRSGNRRTGSAGPAGFSGSLIVAEFASLDDARTWAAADPYAAAGVYAAVEVKPFRQVLPA